MLRNRITVIVMILALLLGSLALVGCSSDDAAEETEATEETAEETGGSEEGAALAGTWEPAEVFYYSSITFNADGTGTISDVDGEEAEMEWSLVDDYLEITLEYDDMTETTGGGFTWDEEGVQFSWDADGTYTKVD